MTTRQLECGLLAGLFVFSGAASAAEPGEPVFQDNFIGALAEGWAWEREDRAAWRAGPAGLEVRVQPGNMWGGANNARNVLVRPIPVPAEAPIEISVALSNAPTAQWEQANLVWYYDGGNMVKLGQELVTGRLSIVMGREENDRARTVAIVPLDDHAVELRLQAFQNRLRGQFRTRHWTGWRDIGECDLPVKGPPKASLHFYNGPANEEHWVKVNRFAVRRLGPAAADWPRQRVRENVCRLASGGPPASAMGALALADGRFALANDLRALRDDPKAACEQRVFLHQDGSYGWTWDRRASSGRQPVRVGAGMGRVDEDSRNAPRFPLEGVGGVAKARSFELNTDAVTRLENDHGDHNLSAEIWLTAAQPGWPATHRIRIEFDWYGREALGQSLNDGRRDYEFVEPKAGAGQAPGTFVYRISGFRGAPPAVNLQAFVTDAVRRGLPAVSSILGVWFGNEVWDGSRGGTLVTRLDLLLDGQRYSSAPSVPAARAK